MAEPNTTILESSSGLLDTVVGRDPRETSADAVAPILQIPVWDVPFASLTREQTLDVLDQRIASGAPGYFITANLHYIMLSHQLPELETVNRDAAFIVADGMPIVWRSRFSGEPLPERVAGADLIVDISELAARRGYRVFFLGGEPGVADRASKILAERFPGLQVAGVEVPPFRELAPHEEAALIDRIRASRPDVLFAALGQPRGERWLHRWHQTLGIPACVQLGGSFNFVTGNTRRAPQWLARTGLEWFFRFCCEPRRLAGRYLSNGCFLLKTIVAEALRLPSRRHTDAGGDT